MLSDNEHIKIFDDRVDPEVLADIPHVEPGEDKSLHEIPHTLTLDKTLQAILEEAIVDYQKVFPALLPKWSKGCGDSGYVVTDTQNTDPQYDTQLETRGRSFITALIFTNVTRSVNFPLQGMCVRGRPGRLLLFPSYWTHPFELKGEGIMVRTQITFPVVAGDVDYEVVKHEW